MSACVFCKIIRKEVPAGIVAEEENALAFMDIMPARKGHVLVVPKAHAETMADIALLDLHAAMSLVHKVARGIQAAIRPPGYSVVQLNGAASGQTVFHVHFHVIPRKSGDGLALKWSHEQYEAGEMERYREQIAEALRAQIPKP